MIILHIYTTHTHTLETMSDLHSFIFSLLHYVLIKPKPDSVYIQSPSTSVQTQAYYSVFYWSKDFNNGRLAK